MAGDGTIDIASDAPVFTIDGSGDKLTAIQLRASANVQLSESGVTEFYFVVAPQTFTQGITVDITGSVNGKEQTIRKQTQKSITVTRSVISSFAAVDTDAELEPEGPTDRDILIALEQYQLVYECSFVGMVWSDIGLQPRESTVYPFVL